MATHTAFDKDHPQRTLKYHQEMFFPYPEVSCSEDDCVQY